MAGRGFDGSLLLENDDSLAGDEPTSPALAVERPAFVPKVPISYLQEICTKRSMQPVYDLLSTEGQVHEPTFMYRVTVNDLSAVGQGKSKKVAKHLAAKALLERIIALGRHNDFGMGETAAEATEILNKVCEAMGPSRGALPGGEEAPAVAGQVAAASSTTGSDDGDGPGNPVGRLQEMSQQQKYPTPTYEMVKEEGMPHDRNFQVRLTLGRFKEEGYGRSKKAAKKEAAEKMLKFLEKLPQEAQRENIGLAEEDELAETGGGQALVQQPFAELDEHLASLSQQQSEDVIVLSSVSKEGKFGLKQLSESDLTKETPNEKHVCLLKLIGEEERWEHEYYPLPRRSKFGDYQCLVQLNAMPVAVCYGRGGSQEVARQSAAYNALEYLKLMTKP